MYALNSYSDLIFPPPGLFLCIDSQFFPMILNTFFSSRLICPAFAYVWSTVWWHIKITSARTKAVTGYTTEDHFRSEMQSTRGLLAGREGLYANVVISTHICMWERLKVSSVLFCPLQTNSAASTSGTLKDFLPVPIFAGNLGVCILICWEH